MTRTQSPGWQRPGDGGAGDVDARVGGDGQTRDERPLGGRPRSPSRCCRRASPVPGWTLVTRAISRAASETPLKSHAARARSTSPMSIVRKIVIAEGELDQPLARGGRGVAASGHGVTVTVRVRVSLPPKFETTSVIV